MPQVIYPTALQTALATKTTMADFAATVITQMPSGVCKVVDASGAVLSTRAFTSVVDDNTNPVNFIFNWVGAATAVAAGTPVQANFYNSTGLLVLSSTGTWPTSTKAGQITEFNLPLTVPLTGLTPKAIVSTPTPPAGGAAYEFQFSAIDPGILWSQAILPTTGVYSDGTTVGIGTSGPATVPAGKVRPYWNAQYRATVLAEKAANTVNWTDFASLCAAAIADPNRATNYNDVPLENLALYANLTGVLVDRTYVKNLVTTIVNSQNTLDPRATDPYGNGSDFSQRFDDVIIPVVVSYDLLADLFTPQEKARVFDWTQRMLNYIKINDRVTSPNGAVANNYWQNFQLAATAAAICIGTEAPDGVALLANARAMRDSFKSREAAIPAVSSYLKVMWNEGAYYDSYKWKAAECFKELDSWDSSSLFSGTFDPTAYLEGYLHIVKADALRYIHLGSLAANTGGEFHGTPRSAIHRWLGWAPTSTIKDQARQLYSRMAGLAFWSRAQRVTMNLQQPLGTVVTSLNSKGNTVFAAGGPVNSRFLKYGHQPAAGVTTSQIALLGAVTTGGAATGHLTAQAGSLLWSVNSANVFEDPEFYSNGTAGTSAEGESLAMTQINGFLPSSYAQGRRYNTSPDAGLPVWLNEASFTLPMAGRWFRLDSKPYLNLPNPRTGIPTPRLFNQKLDTWLILADGKVIVTLSRCDTPSTNGQVDKRFQRHIGAQPTIVGDVASWTDNGISFETKRLSIGGAYVSSGNLINLDLDTGTPYTKVSSGVTVPDLTGYILKSPMWRLTRTQVEDNALAIDIASVSGTVTSSSYNPTTKTISIIINGVTITIVHTDLLELTVS